MSTISVNLPSDGTTADVADYNTPINTIVNEFNGNIDNANIKSGAAISGSKLADNSIDIEAKASTDTGWREVTDSWSYASATTITVPSDATAKYSVGDKIRLTQSTVKYFYITGVASTTLTINGGTDYTLANEAISDVSYSKALTPQGFPQYFAYSPTLSGRLDDGDWTKDCRFSMQGKNVIFNVSLIASAAAPMGGGVTNAIFTLPVTSAAIPGTDTRMSIGQAILVDANGNTINGPVLFGSTTTGIVFYWTGDSILATITSTSPFTWTTNDEITIAGFYEAA